MTDGNHSFPATYDFAIYPDLVDHEQEYYYDSNGNEMLISIRTLLPLVTIFLIYLIQCSLGMEIV